MLKTAVPKPPPREPAARKPVKRRNVKNHKRDFVKHFHSGERVDFVNSLPCVVGRVYCGPRDNHHARSRGAGGDYEDIVPMCELHHGDVHHWGRETFERVYRIDLAVKARETERAWQLHLQQTPK